MTMPVWLFSDVMTQVNAFLSNSVVSGLVLGSIALSVAGWIVSLLRRVTR